MRINLTREPLLIGPTQNGVVIIRFALIVEYNSEFSLETWSRTDAYSLIRVIDKECSISIRV